MKSSSPMLSDKPDPAPPASAQPTKPEAPEKATEHRQDNNSAGDNRSSRERSTTENSSPFSREEEHMEPPRFEPAVPVSASTRPIHSAEAALDAPGTRPAVARHTDLEPTTVQAAPSVRTSDAHSISLRLTDAGDQTVELKITDRAGEVKVAVRTADPDLAGSLRDNLGDLVHKLEQSGLRADNWHPAPGPVDSARQLRQSDGESSAGDQSGRQQQHSGEGHQRRQQQQHPERAAWLEEFETNLDSERSTTPWQPA